MLSGYKNDLLKQGIERDIILQLQFCIICLLRQKLLLFYANYANLSK